MAGTFNPLTGRTTHVTDNGYLIESKPMFFSGDEWILLYSLAKDSGVSLGKLIVALAKSERERRLDRCHRQLQRLDPVR
ncbi:hypothetical protein [Polaromonas hydrogenivorans]|uniref:Uncharacterized protein n=1 Tax=Polaromonas hydrogenivorans TaxID=335476 RepID=A0AAU7LRX1_9BURK